MKRSQSWTRKPHRYLAKTAFVASVFFISSCDTTCAENSSMKRCRLIPVDCGDNGVEIDARELEQSESELLAWVDGLEDGEGRANIAWWIDSSVSYRRVDLSFESIRSFSEMPDGRPVWTVAGKTSCSQSLVVALSFVSTAETMEEAMSLVAGTYSLISVSTDSVSAEQGSWLSRESEEWKDTNQELRILDHSVLGKVVSFDATPGADFNTYFVNKDVLRGDSEYGVQIGSGVMILGELE